MTTSSSCGETKSHVSAAPRQSSSNSAIEVVVSNPPQAPACGLRRAYRIVSCMLSAHELIADLAGPLRLVEVDAEADADVYEDIPSGQKLQDAPVTSGAGNDNRR